MNDREMGHNDSPLMVVDNLSVSFPGDRPDDRLRAADHVNLSIYPSQTLAVVGESGSGKSVTALSVLKLIPTPPGRYESGRVLWRQGGTERPVNLMDYSDRQMRQVRGNQIAMIFQEPMTSLNPVYTIGEQIIEAILLHQRVTYVEAMAIAEKSLSDVGIADPGGRLKEYPHQMSGGMRQRVMIAMALACQPRLLLADEPTTALDVTIQAQILDLLRHLQREKQMSIMLITHDLGVVAENADVVAVMYAGRIVEYASVYEVFQQPMHPYTRGLLKSMPVLGRNIDRLPTVMDSATIPEDIPSGFEVAPHFPDPHPPGGYGGREAKLYEVRNGHWLLCRAVNEQANEQLTPPRLTFRR